MDAAEREQLLAAAGDLIVSGRNSILRRRPDLMAPIE